MKIEKEWLKIKKIFENGLKGNRFKVGSLKLNGYITVFLFFSLVVHSLHSIGIYLASNLCNVGLPFLGTMDTCTMYLDGNYNWWGIIMGSGIIIIGCKGIIFCTNKY